MAEIAPAVVAAAASLAGAGVGATVALISGRASRRSAERIPAAQRNLSARELAAVGFASARAAVASFHPSMVESADAIPLPKWVRRHRSAHEAQLADAIAKLDQVSALLAGSDTGSTAAACARELVVFDDAWRTAVNEGAAIHFSLPPAEHDQAEAAWFKALSELKTSRHRLLGYTGESLSDEARTQLAGLLGSLAKTIGAAN